MSVISWNQFKIENLCEVIRGVTYKKGDASESPKAGYLPILRATNIQENKLVLDSDLVYVPSHLVSKEQKLRQGDILIATSSGSKHLVGKSGLVTADVAASFGAFCAVVRPNESINPKYLGHFFTSDLCKKQISEKALGVNINNLRRGDIEAITVPVAPPKVQEVIVAEIEKQFSRLDEAVTALKRIQANLRRYKASVLKAAVEGKLTEQWRKAHPDIEPADQLLKRILAERRAKWEAEELAKMMAKGVKPKDDSWKKKYKEPAGPDTANLPELPGGWVWVALGQLIEEPSYGTSKKCDYGSGSIGVLRIPNIASGIIDCDDLKSADFDENEKHTYALQAGDILTIRSNGSVSLVGKCALVRNEDIKFLFAGYLIRLRPSSGGTSSKYLMACFSSQLLRRQIEAKAKSTSGVNNINAGELQSLVVPLCSNAEQHQIVVDLDCTLSVTEELEAAIETNLIRAERLRQIILQEAFSGDMR